MSRFTDELRNLDGMRNADELLPAAAYLIDEMETALRRLLDVQPDESPRYSVTDSEFNDAKICAHNAISKLEELSK